MKYLILILLNFIPLTKSIAQIKCPDVSDRKLKKKSVEKKSFGILLGYNNTTVTKTSENDKIKNLNRFQAGIYINGFISKIWFLKGSIVYNQKGNFYDNTYGIADGGKVVTIKLNYVEASLDVGYRINVTATQSINFAAGPYIAVGINGTERGYGESIFGPIKIDKKAVFTNSKFNNGTNLQIKPINFGLNFNIAYQYGKYGLYINYGFGLMKLEDGVNSKNRVASVGVSYSFK
jgi:Outer membrane protein beta-barrel domain